MNGKIALLTLVSLFAFAACQRNNTETAADKNNCCTGSVSRDVAAEKVLGSWKWIETTYFSENHGKLLKTPLNTGKKLTYTFGVDSLIISSGALVTDRIHYEIGMLKDITSFSQDTTPIIRLTGAGYQNRISLLHFCCDSIILVNSYNNLGGNIILKRAG
jgi:hypothetical protein